MPNVADQTDMFVCEPMLKMECACSCMNFVKQNMAIAPSRIDKHAHAHGMLHPCVAICQNNSFHNSL